MPIPVAIVPCWLLDVVIDVGPFYHVGHVRADPVQDGPGLGIRIDMFATGARDRGGVIRKLCDEENN